MPCEICRLIKKSLSPLQHDDVSKALHTEAVESLCRRTHSYAHKKKTKGKSGRRKQKKSKRMDEENVSQSVDSKLPFGMRSVSVERSVRPQDIHLTRKHMGAVFDATRVDLARYFFGSKEHVWSLALHLG